MDGNKDIPTSPQPVEEQPPATPWHAELAQSAGQSPPSKDGAPSQPPAPAPETDNAAAGSAASQPNWTVAIDLAWHFKTSPEMQSAEDRIAQLKNETAGKPVEFVVQLYRPATGQQGGAPKIDRILIHDGQVTDLGEQDSAGPAKDLASLLDTAATKAPSQHIALVMTEDGIASRGFLGDSGSLSIPELNQAVHDGLKGRNDGKLDVLDMNSCLMGDTAVLAGVQPVAAHVVGSAELESMNVDPQDPSKRHIGQDTSATLHDLLGNPNMTPGQLADTFVKHADQEAAAAKTLGENKTPEMQAMAGTATLAHYDLSQLSNFEANLNQFGQTLTGAAKDLSNKLAIEEAVTESSRLGAGQPVSQHDLKSFVDKIVESIQSGKLKDPDGAIKNAADKLLKAQDSLISSRHLDSSPDYANQGALGTFLPDQGFYKEVDERTSLNWLFQLSGQMVDKDTPAATRQQLLEQLDSGFDRFKSFLPAESLKNLTPLTEARQALANASDGKEFAAGLADYRNALRNLADQRGVIEGELAEGHAELDKWLTSGSINASPSWTAFVKLLSADAPGNQ